MFPRSFSRRVVIVLTKTSHLHYKQRSDVRSVHVAVGANAKSSEGASLKI